MAGRPELIGKAAGMLEHRFCSSASTRDSSVSPEPRRTRARPRVGEGRERRYIGVTLTEMAADQDRATAAQCEFGEDLP